MTDRIGRYKDEDACKRRVKKLRTLGINTGYRVYEDGSASPLYDPEDSELSTRHDRKADE
jgi:hypothetical protein